MECLRACGGPESDFGGAELIIGELIANAGRYTPGPICIELDWTGNRVRATVHDGGRGFVWQPSLPSATAERGRGLFIVNALAEDVRVDADSSGCRVSATLPILARELPRAVTCPQKREPSMPGVCYSPRSRITERSFRDAH